jgi:cell wall integrity and stress response component
MLLFFLATFITLSAAQNVYQGCYQLDSTLNLTDTSIYQSKGRCGGQICEVKNYAVFGMTSGSQCLCGNSIPAKQVTPDHCQIQCPGYPDDTCTSIFDEVNIGGGTGYISVWLTGVGKLTGNAATTILSDDSSTATTSSPSHAGASNTVYVTAGGRNHLC